jgi:hypothetical protein
MLNNTSASVPGSRILGLGHYQPSNVVTNDDLVARGVDTNDAWIRSRVGIAERRFADPDETVIDMGEAAASKALSRRWSRDQRSGPRDRRYLHHAIARAERRTAARPPAWHCGTRCL